MNREYFSSGLAVLLSVAAIFVSANSARTNKRLTDGQAARATELQALIDQSADGLRGELVTRLDGIIEQLGLAEPNPTENIDLKELSKLARSDPYMAKMLKEAIESVVLNKWPTNLRRWTGRASFRARRSKSC